MSWYTTITPQWFYFILAVLGLAAGLFFSYQALDLDGRAFRNFISASIFSVLVMIYALVVALLPNYYHVTSGIVTATGYEPARVVVTNSCTSTGKTTVCTPTTTHQDAYWWIKVDDGQNVGRFDFQSDQSTTHPVGSHYSVEG